MISYKPGMTLTINLHFSILKSVSILSVVILWLFISAQGNSYLPQQCTAYICSFKTTDFSGVLELNIVAEVDKSIRHFLANQFLLKQNKFFVQKSNCHL